MLLRVAFGVGLLALGYYVGREMGRTESLRRELGQDQGPDDPGSDRGPASAAAPDQSSAGPSSRARRPRG